MGYIGNDPCASNAKPDEPLFTLLARDPMAAITVRFWAILSQRSGRQPKEWIDQAIEVADLMDEYIEEHHPEKVPFRDAMDAR